VAVRRACIDIGSNTTRLLVADCDAEHLREVHQQRAFTHLRTGLRADGTIAPEAIKEAAETVAEHVRIAREFGATEIHAVATAAVRHARNGPEVKRAIRTACAIELEILSEHDEARLAFIGAARTLDHVPDGSLGVVDVGGGSSELVVGTAPDRVSWSTSVAVGSGVLADRCLASDPPSTSELEAAKASVADALKGVTAPAPSEAVAVGGSASSLRTLAGPRLDRAAFTRSLTLLAGAKAADVARRFGLELDRVRLLPAGLLILQAASELFGAALELGVGGLREGVLLEAAR
jgi:exopolyphosphatase/guanosine-5'-triphosphate,3'-diphosphate pyrophosphatase